MNRHIAKVREVMEHYATASAGAPARSRRLTSAIESATIDAREQGRPMVVRLSPRTAGVVIIGPSRGSDPALVACTVHPDGRVEHENPIL